MFKENSIKKEFIKDHSGQVFSLDALLALIIITVIIGMSANAMDIVGFKIADYSAGKSLDRITTDAAEILINTPGSSNWENNNNSLYVTPGLAESNNGGKNTTNILSIKKITQLENRYTDLMDNIIPRGGKSSLIIYPADTALKTLVMGNETPSSNVSVVAVANRTVLVDFMNFTISVSLNTYFNNSLTNESENSTEFCPHHNLTGILKHEKPNFNSNTPGWTCRHFKISQQDLNSTDFYILTDPSAPKDGSARWILDRPDKTIEEQENFKAHPQLVNEKISDILGDDDEALLWLHVLTSGDESKSFNVYLIGVPKGTSPEEVRVEYLNPQPCFFVLKLWM